MCVYVYVCVRGGEGAVCGTACIGGVHCRVCAAVSQAGPIQQLHIAEVAWWVVVCR